MARGLRFTAKDYQRYAQKNKQWHKEDWESFYGSEVSQSPLMSKEHCGNRSKEETPPATQSKKSGIENYYALGHKKAGEMNKTEARYANYLDMLKFTHEIVDYCFEPAKYTLAPRTGYTPDFMVQPLVGKTEFHEVKGSKAVFRDDAKVKLKVFADKYRSFFKVKAVYPSKNGWVFEDYN